ncbi:hypothetical protein AVEN_19733-1 [Araneus ventricosus]|uniref:Uncharacterized protein n=1 Tax=Araneus ventricosus TaxID=182803 RepID=A0A4Y2C5W3_ARAVE|nr:hypothetical protein AVEN_19733-1 [Araneus ventricosus]
MKGSRALQHNLSDDDFQKDGCHWLSSLTSGGFLQHRVRKLVSLYIMCSNSVGSYVERDRTFDQIDGQTIEKQFPMMVGMNAGQEEMRVAQAGLEQRMEAGQEEMRSGQERMKKGLEEMKALIGRSKGKVPEEY